MGNLRLNLTKHWISLVGVLLIVLSLGLFIYFKAEIAHKPRRIDLSDFFSTSEFQSNAKVDRNAIFAAQERPKHISLPEDFDFQPSAKQEQWHYFANLVDKSGQEYSVQWVYERVTTSNFPAAGWRNPRLFIVTTIITNSSHVWREQRLARSGIGQAGLQTTPFNLWIDNWTWSSLGTYPLPSKLTVQTDDISIALTSLNEGPYIVDGNKGYLRTSPTTPSNDTVGQNGIYSFQAPYIKVSGYLKLDDYPIEVKGHAWLSKEWGDHIIPQNNDKSLLLNIRLDNERSLLVRKSQLDGFPPTTYAIISYLSGMNTQLFDDDVSIEPIKYSRITNSAELPLEWRVSIPKVGIEFTFSAINNNQWHDLLVPYWQGPIHAVNANGSATRLKTYDKYSDSSLGFLRLNGY